MPTRKPALWIRLNVFAAFALAFTFAGTISAPVRALAGQLGDTPKPAQSAAPAVAATAPAMLKPASNLVVENIPPIPTSVVESAAPYTESRTASFLDWSPQNGASKAHPILIGTRFGNTIQVHSVVSPGAARQQLTFFADPVLSAQYQPVEGRYILLTKDVGGAEFYQFYRYDVATGETTLVTDGTSRNTDPVFSRDGKMLAFGSTRRNGESVDLWVVDPANPASARMLTQMSGGGLNVGGWSPDGKTIAIVDEISINESNIYLVDIATGERKQLTPPQGDVRVSWNEPRFAADGKSIFVLADKDSEFHRLCRLSLTGQLQSCLTDAIKWDVEHYALSRDGKWVVFDTNEDGISKLHLLSLADNREHPTPQLPPGVIGSINFNEDSRNIGISFTSAQQPSDAYSFTTDSPSLERWTTSETGGVSLTAKRSPELIHWKAADAVTISGFLYPAAASFTGKRPVIISIHGGPEGQSRPTFNSTDNYFTQKLGIVVIQPNVRGSTGYGKTYTLLDNGIKRQDSIHDIGALLDWIKTRPDLDSDRILITGGSYGGFMTLSIATQYNDRIRASVEIVGMSSLVTFLEHTSGYRRDLRRAEYGDERDPLVRAYMEKTAPMNNAQNITKPMMIVAGFNDPRVPWTESRQIADKLKQQNTPMWFLMANDEGHGFRKKNNRDFQFFATIEFLQKYLLNE